MEKITISGKEYEMKDVSILGVKMRGMKSITECNLDKMPEWIGDEAKEKIASDSFTKFLTAIFTEPYTGLPLLELTEREVVAITSLFFKSAAASTILS